MLPVLMICYLSSLGQDNQLNKEEINLSGTNLSVKDIIDKVQSQTNFDFSYSSGSIDLERKVNFTNASPTLNHILNELKRQAGIGFLLSGSQILLNRLGDEAAASEEKAPKTNSVVNSKPIIIEGKVVDNNTQEPLIGVTVTVTGTSKGAITDVNGNYRIEIDSDAESLSFSYVGYKTKLVEIDNQKEINVALDDDISSLEEIVVTALAIKKSPEKIGYATQKVDGSALTKTQEPNIVANLTGKVAGLTVFNSTDFFANNSFSLRGENPLIVIDGVPNTTTNLWEINANDVESIDVLKGAPAAALYGSLGRNGAIMITTKRGNQKEGLRVEFNSNTMVQFDFLRIPETQDRYGSGRNGIYRYVDGTGAGPEGSGFSWGPPLDEPDPTTPSGFVELVQYNSPIDPETGERVPLPWISRGSNNLKNFFRNGVISNNTLAVTAGNLERNVRVSASHKLQRGIVPNTQLGSSNFSVAGKYTFNKLSVDASINYNRQESDNIPEVAWSSQSFIYNLALWMGANIDVNDLKDYWIEGQEGFQQRHYSTSFYNNPHFLANEFSRGYYRDVTYGQLFLNYNFSDDLILNMRTGINFFSLNRNTKEPISFVRNFNRTDGDYSQSFNSSFNINTDIFLNYSKTINKYINIQSTVGLSNNYINNWFSNVSTNGSITPFFIKIRQ
ncbi:MAG: carboxypeptidase-like regulatory domain-containing protein [Cyclobacteriaceae bacterium]